MPEIATFAELQVLVLHAQAARQSEVHCTLSVDFAARTTECQLQVAFDQSLPLVQARTWQLKRIRGRGATLLSRLTYRDSVRMLMGALPVPDLARTVAAEACRRYPNEAERFCWLYGLLSVGVTYAHTAPGARGYDRLVGASGVLATGKGNCQGFADTLHLLARLSGLSADIALGPGERGLHAWNLVCLDGIRYASDASRGSRAWRTDGASGLLKTCLMPSNGASIPLKMQCIQEILAASCDFFHDFDRKSENPPFPTAPNVI